MNIIAYTDARYVTATRQLVSDAARVITSPPTYARDVQPEWFTGYDVVYLDLHGLAGSVYLYSGQHAENAALSVETVRAMQLNGAVVFATTCFLPQTPFVKAFLQAGASAVIGGDGENFGGKTRLTGAQVLARLVLRELRDAHPVQAAVDRAKKVLRANLRFQLFDRRSAEDALQFKLFTPDNVEAI